MAPHSPQAGPGRQAVEDRQAPSDGLGTTAEYGRAEVRELARKYRQQIKAKIDPKDQCDTEDAEKEATERANTDREHAEKKREYQAVRRVARAFHAAQIEPRRSGKHGQQWINSIEQHVPANLLDKPIADVTAKELHDVLLSLRATVRGK